VEVLLQNCVTENKVCSLNEFLTLIGLPLAGGSASVCIKINMKCRKCMIEYANNICFVFMLTDIDTMVYSTFYHICLFTFAIIWIACYISPGKPSLFLSQVQGSSCCQTYKWKGSQTSISH